MRTREQILITTQRNTDIKTYMYHWNVVRCFLLEEAAGGKAS